MDSQKTVNMKSPHRFVVQFSFFSRMSARSHIAPVNRREVGYSSIVLGANLILKWLGLGLPSWRNDVLVNATGQFHLRSRHHGGC